MGGSLMPQRMPTYKPPRVRTARPRRDDTARPNAAARGYCSKAWAKIRQAVLIRDAWQCQDCGRVCADKREAHVDHVTPKAQGGQDTLDNLRTLCIRCHGRKTVQEQKANAQRRY
jgi:5-methylcytosine-specific restriction protein A